MTIKIIEEPAVHVTAGDLARYREDYQRDYSMYCGPLPTLEEYIRRRQARDGQANHIPGGSLP
jgi:hypothetical protein